jgi:uncharacterized protein
MNSFETAAKEFLSRKKIAVAGVSSKGDTAANIVYKKLRECDFAVFAVNPNATEAEGDRCYPSLSEIPEKIDGVLVGTHPDVTPGILHECARLGIKQVWIHRSFGQGSYHPDAEKIAKKNGISLIPGGCPMMFCEPVDIGHKCIKWILKVTGKQAKPAGY